MCNASQVPSFGEGLVGEHRDRGMEFIDDSHKVIGRVNILVHYDANVKILLNRRLCELVVRLYNVARRHCLPVWKRCKAAIPKCQLALKEFYRQLVLGETLVQSSSSQHFWKLRKVGTELQYLHSCDSALQDWEKVEITEGKPAELRCDRLRHHVKLVQENDQLSVKHSCLCAGGCDQESVPLRFREGKVISLPCISEHWLKLSIVGAPQGAFVVQFLLDLYWHMIQVNRSLFVSEMHEQTKSRVAHRWQILCCGVILSDKYHKYLAAEREKGLGSFVQCQEDCELLLKKLQYVADQGPRVECKSLTEEDELHNHRHDIATFVLEQLANRYQVADKYRINHDGHGSQQSPQNPLSNTVWLPQYLNIDDSKVEHYEYIADGSFGSVWTCHYLGERLAAKIFKDSRGFRDTFPNELKSLYKLKHFHIVQLMGYIESDSKSLLLVELMEKKDLRKTSTTRDAPFPLHVAVDILLQIARGMKYSHESGVMHRDLKATNILVKRIMSNGNSEGNDLSEDGYLYVKLTDFGFATEYRNVNPMSNVGTRYWKAPEVLRGGQYSKPADVYSFAVTCNEVFGGQPFEKWKGSDKELLDALMQGIRPSVENCPAYLADYIGRCWDTEPGNRPSFVDICVVLLHYKSVLMKADFVPSANYRISTEEHMIELACQGGLKWLTREVLNHGIDWVDVDSNYSRIPRDIFLDCLGKWEYPKPKSGDTARPESPSAPILNLSAGVELSPQDSSGSLLEGFEKLCVVHYEWQDVLKGLPEAWVLVGDYYASWETKRHNFKEALKWFEKASSYGHPDSFVRIGICYESGYGTERNFELAIQNYEKAASKHSSAGYVYLGLAYAASADRKEEGLQFWQKAVDYQIVSKSSISIIKLLINIMLRSAEDPENVYANVVNKLLRMTMMENSIGRKLVAGAAPKCANVRLVVDAVREAAVEDEQRSTKIAILRNLSTEPDIAERIREAGGAQVLIGLLKESCEPNSRLVSKILLETFCNVIHEPIEQENVLKSFRKDRKDTSGLTSEEMETFRSKIQTYLGGLEENNTSSPGVF